MQKQKRRTSTKGCAARSYWVVASVHLGCTIRCESPEGVVIDPDSLFAALAKLQDQRDARGLRYSLVTVLVFVVLAKLCGEDYLRGIAQWVELRKDALAEALGWPSRKRHMPRLTAGC